MSKLRFMSNNIWNCGSNKPWWAERGLDCSAENRIPGFIRVYSETIPDVIGLQECGPKMSDPLLLALEEQNIPYAMLFGRYTSILYRADKLELIDSEYHIFSEELPPFEGCFNDAKSKSYCIGVFRTKDEGKTFIFATTHLWWKSGDPTSAEYQAHSDEARTHQLGVVLDRAESFIEKYNCPAIIVGDLNTPYTSDTISSALTRTFMHAHDVATDYKDERDGYHYCYPDGYDTYEHPKSFEDAIDHILIKNAPAGFVKRFERYTPEYYMPLSDHFPVFADVEL